MIDSSNTVIRQVAKKLNIDDKIVKLIHDYYWKEGVKGSMRSGKHTAIRVSKIGTFVVSKTKLYKRIQKYIAFIRHLQNTPESEFKRISKEKRINQYKSDLALLLERRNDIAKLYIRKSLKSKSNDKISETSLGE